MLTHEWLIGYGWLYNLAIQAFPDWMTDVGVTEDNTDTDLNSNDAGIVDSF